MMHFIAVYFSIGAIVSGLAALGAYIGRCSFQRTVYACIVTFFLWPLSLIEAVLLETSPRYRRFGFWLNNRFKPPLPPRD